MARNNRKIKQSAKQLIKRHSTRAIKPVKKSADQRAYEASSNGRRLGGWDSPSLSPTNAITTELELLQRRNRSAIRNNPWVARALKADVANEIGTGIVPRPTTSDDRFNKEILDLWNDYIHFADINSNLGVYGIQWQASRARKESGEAFIRIIRRRNAEDLPVPLQFQVLESEFCPVGFNKELKNGYKIVSGIEVNKYGRVVAYHIYPKHPSDESVSIHDLIRIPASDMLHHFIPNRPGQLRGEPSGTQSMVRAYVFDKYDDAELGRKESRAHFTGVIRRPEYGEQDYKFDPISGEPISKDDSEVPMIEMETGTFPNLLPGEDVTLFEGDDAGRGYKDYQHYQLLGIAAGWNVPYQLMSGDYTEINDRLWRAIMNQYQREVEQVQDLFVIAQICRLMWNAFVKRAILAGVVQPPESYKTNKFDYLRCLHRPQSWKHIHPTQDIEAKILEINAGLTSRQRVVDETRRESVEEIDRQRAEDLQREEELGLNYGETNEEPFEDAA